MGSFAQTISQDQRVGISGDAYQVTAPQSQLINPLGFGTYAGTNSSAFSQIKTGDILYNDLSQVNTLVTSIMDQTKSTLESIADQNRDTLSTLSNLGNDVLAGVSTAANEIKEPLTKYIPIAVLLVIVFVFAKTFMKK